MYQQINNWYNFTLLKPFHVGKKNMMFFLTVLCLLLLPAVTHATCVLSGIVWYCTTEAECGSKLQPLEGQPGTWPVETTGSDCVCAGATNYPYYTCSCCEYMVTTCPSPSNPCCGSSDSCCGVVGPCCPNGQVNQ
jgi:hypothetical protein